MARRSPQSRAYSDPTAQQLSSLAAVARCEGVASAAAQLGLSAPTVRQQIRALEQAVGESLVTSTDRSSVLTDAGRTLADLTGPLAADLATLKDRFRAARATRPPRLRVAATPRIFLEDLPQVIPEFRSTQSETHLMVREASDSLATELVLEGDAEVALISRGTRLAERDAGLRRGLHCQGVYHLAVTLVTPKQHPLARKKVVSLEDLIRFPFVNSPADLQSLGVTGVVRAAGLEFAKQMVEVFVTANVRAAVLAGHGIGLIPKPEGSPIDPTLAERPLGELFGSKRVYSVIRSRKAVSPPLSHLVSLLRARFGG